MRKHQRFYRGKVFDYGHGWAEITSAFEESSLLGVELHRESCGVLSSRECRLLAGFLCEAAEWLDGRCGITDSPNGTIVYVITDGHWHHKIGKAVNFASRLRQLQTGNGRLLRLVAYLPCDTESDAYAAETAAKKSLQDCAGIGEWFQCNSHFAWQALHEGASAAGVYHSPVNVRVGHDDNTFQSITNVI